MPVIDKDKWINIERQRWAKLFNIPVGPPPEGFPVSTLTVRNAPRFGITLLICLQIQRALCALLLINPLKLVPAIDALYKAYWAESNVALVNKPEGLTKLLKTILTDAEAEEVVKKAKLPATSTSCCGTILTEHQSSQAEAKALLSKNSADAMADGCFGMPYFVGECVQQIKSLVERR